MNSVISNLLDQTDDLDLCSYHGKFKNLLKNYKLLKENIKNKQKNRYKEDLSLKSSKSFVEILRKLSCVSFD